MFSAPAKCAVVLLTVINKSKHDKRAAVPSKSLNIESYMLDSNALNVLHIPAGYISSIQASSSNSKFPSFTNFL